MQGSFSQESLDTFSALVSQSPGINYSESQKYTYDFTRCVRNDGSAYGTGGACRKGTEATALDVLQSGIKGRVPKDDPKEPLATGSTPLEKAKEKLKLFESLISDPNRTPSDKELEQFGKLKIAVQEFENKKEGGKKGLFGKVDKSDLDESKSREMGKERRKLFPKIEDRQTIVRASQIHRKYLSGKDPLLRRRNNASAEEVLRLERDHRSISNTLTKLDALIEKLPNKTNFLRSTLENFRKTVKQAEQSYGKAVTRLTTAKPKAPKPEVPKGEPKYHRDGSVTYHV